MAAHAEIAVREAVEECGTGDTVKSDGERRDADRLKVLLKPGCGNPHGRIIDWKRADVGTPQGDGSPGVAAAKQAVVLVEEELERNATGTRARVGKQHPRKRLTPLGQGAHPFHARPAMPERPLNVRH